MSSLLWLCTCNDRHDEQAFIQASLEFTIQQKHQQAGKSPSSVPAGGNAAAASLIVILPFDEQRDTLLITYERIFAAYQTSASNIGAHKDAIVTAPVPLVAVFLHPMCDIESISASVQRVLLPPHGSADCHLPEALMKLPQIVIAANGSQKGEAWDERVKENPLTFYESASNLGTDPHPAINVGKFSFGQFGKAALGGTFDHLHMGHLLLLSMAALLSRSCVYCGVTSASMLERKSNLAQMEPVQIRMSKVAAFLKLFKPACKSYLEEIYDPNGGTVDPSLGLDVLIATVETESGTRAVNAAREAKGMQPLAIVITGCIMCSKSEKISSSAIRSKESARRSLDAERTGSV